MTKDIRFVGFDVHAETIAVAVAEPDGQLRAKHRLSKFLLRHGWRPAEGIKAWTVKYLEWVKKDVEFEHEAQKATLLDYITEVDHARDRIARLEKAIDEAAAAAPERMRA